MISTSEGQPVAHVERHSRNRGKRFKNPHAYVVTVAAGADVALLVAVCVCLDESENTGGRIRGREHRTRAGGTSGSIDTAGFGSACF